MLGGTGFLGKIFWVMLLARFPSVGHIYLLVRKSKTKTSEERFWSEIATSECLDPLRTLHGDGFEAFLQGEDRRRSTATSASRTAASTRRSSKELKGTIDAVVNVAGVVDFNPPLDEALDTNAFGAQNLVALAKALGDAPLMHTSTCYVVGNRDGPHRRGDAGRALPLPARRGARSRPLGSRSARSPTASTSSRRRKSRCEDAFRQSEFLERATKNLDAPRRADRGAPLEDELKSVKRKYVSDRLVEAGPRARHALGLAEHLHVHEEHRRADHRARRASRSPSRAPRAARARSSSRSPAGTRASAPRRRSSSSR